MAARFSAKFQVVINEDACFLFLFFLSLKFGRAQNSCYCCCWYIKQREREAWGLRCGGEATTLALFLCARVRKEQVLSECIISGACASLSPIVASLNFCSHYIRRRAQLAAQIFVLAIFCSAATETHTQRALAFLRRERERRD
jgi:hypothetical protein